MRKLLSLLALLVATNLSAQTDRSLLEIAQQFRTLVNEERWEEARVLMSDDPRRWFEEREGEGRPWEIGPAADSWYGWDKEFRSQSTILDWHQRDRSATVKVAEINDYYRLLDRGAGTTEITYFFDDAGKIDGLLIRAVGERSPGRTNEFLRWALENEPDELRALMPKGSIDPSGDHPRRFRALLERWRAESGLPQPGEPQVSGVEAAPPPERSPLHALAERFIDAWLANDPEAVMATLAEDAVLMPHHGVQPVEGAQAIRSFWFPADGTPAIVKRFEQTYPEIDEQGDVGWARGRFILDFEWNGETTRNEGNYMMFFQRRSGEWKITHRIWND